MLKRQGRVANHVILQGSEKSPRAKRNLTNV